MSRKVLLAALLGAAQVMGQGTPVSSDLYSKFVRYTNFAGAAYMDSCPTPPSGSSVVQYFNNSATDTQATLFQDRTAKELILSFRGTSTPIDLDTDFLFTLTALNVTGATCPDCKVHQGFQAAYLSVANDVVAAVKKAQASAPGYSFTVTGHSLGAGLAAIAASALTSQGISNFPVYTFGEPRNGNPAFTSYINTQVKNYYRVTHFNDGVPQIPPTSLGFQHHGVEYWESKNSSNSASTTLQCTGIEPTGCNAARDFGSNPINGAHIYYSDIYLASALFNPGCGFKQPS